MWNDKFSWSSETPTSYPDLNPAALARITDTGGGEYNDAVDDTRLWRYESGAGFWWGRDPGPWGICFRINYQDPASEQGRLQLDNFSGMWPTTGKVLVGLWAQQSYTMDFNPLLDTRATDPFVYLSTAGGSGQVRQQVYSAGGSLLLDQYESGIPWTGTSDWYYIGMLMDLDNNTSRVFSVHEDGRTWRCPERSFSGTANGGSEANLDVFSLRHADFYERGFFDEVLIAHPGAEFDLAEFVGAMGRSRWADGQADDHYEQFEVTETGITALEAATFSTGAELVAWERQPAVPGLPAGAVAHLSDDDGDTWESQPVEEFPAEFDGLLRWDIPLGTGETFTGLEVREPDDPAPTLQPIADVVIEQGELLTVELEHTISGPADWEVQAPEVVAVSQTEETLSIAAGFEVGDGTIEVTLTDELGRSVSRSFEVTVEPRVWEDGPPPVYPYTPIIVWDEEAPQAVIIDPVEAVVTKEVNGAETFELTVPASHKHTHLIQNERILEVAGERYWVRRTTKERVGRRTMLEVYAEARFYELSTADEVEAQEWDQVTAGRVMETAVEGTGWSVGTANVTTRRSYSVEDGNPLELLRTVQENHGGDLIFNNQDRTVSLVTQSGRDNGVAFFYGRGLSDSKRVVDTTSLVTRLYARNEDGLSIDSVNNGRAYVEDFSFTEEVRSATYKFKSGTAPHSMLSMAQATLANRSRPDFSYEVTVNDLSARTGEELDRFDIGDRVTVVDPEIGLEETQRIMRLEYDIIRPWASNITLSARLRETGDSDTENAGELETGAGVDTFDLVPFNLLLNSRFDNGLAHWANHGVEVVDGGGTGDYAVRFEGSGERWIEQTVQPDNRSAYAFSFDLETSGPTGWEPDLIVQAVVTYEDGETETIDLDLS
ncbi:phage tail protein [Nesterenkonia sp. E16_7]|uniref:phage tail protein n=1 Tax=unclassified Nesterenkonia TaxID=2629769 RepID=UPI001A90CF60|nr:MULTISPECIES: phage tail protein [unclassified Nesterenkonia]MBO0596595.1 phage tail protein [Nesterenkonia sp. E16_10]MBO0598372.1 phage tail protein [Nesterenkonia sp. E16_7]